MDEVDKTIARLESELSLPSGFFDALPSEDDWSFVIKSHALVESACSHLLTAYFGKPNYQDIFSRLEMSDKRTGKVAFLREAGLLIPEEARFIIALSELRNKLVHNIGGMAFNFSGHVASLDKNQTKSFVQSFGYFYLERNAEGKPVAKDTDLVLMDPKKAIFSGVKLVLAIIKVQVETQQFELENHEHRRAIYELTQSLTSASSRQLGPGSPSCR